MPVLVGGLMGGGTGWEVVVTKKSKLEKSLKTAISFAHLLALSLFSAPFPKSAKVRALTGKPNPLIFIFGRK